MPMTYNRAATAIVRCRSGLGRVRSDLELALAILEILGEEGRPDPGEPVVGRTAVRDLELIRDHLADMQRAFEGAVTSLRDLEPTLAAGFPETILMG